MSNMPPSSESQAAVRPQAPALYQAGSSSRATQRLKWRAALKEIADWPPEIEHAVTPQARLCLTIERLVSQTLTLSGARCVPYFGDHRMPAPRLGRRGRIHIRQIAMYLARVVAQISLTDIGRAFGRDRTTVAHACRIVEDRRDDAAYDLFVQSNERIVAIVLLNGMTEGALS